MSTAGRVQCVVTTPEKTLLDEAVDFVALPLYDGELGVLPGRGPLIGRLGFGELRTRSGGQTKRYFVDGGFAQIRDDTVTVLTSRAIPASEINRTQVTEQLQAVRERKAVTEAEQAEKARVINRSLAMIRVAERG